MEKIWGFAKRHRGKLIIAGVVGAVSAGGLYLVHRLADAKYREWKEKEANEVLEKLKQQHFFETTWRTGNQTLKTILPALVNSISKALDTNRLVAKIKESKTFEETVEIWQLLKVMSLGRIVAFIVSCSYVELFVRCQLSILAGYSYRTTVAKSSVNDKNENHRLKPSEITSQVQEMFLSICQLFVDVGVHNLCQKLVDDVIGPYVESRDFGLEQSFSLADLEKILREIIDDCSEICLTETKNLLTSNQLPTISLSNVEKECLDVLFGETFDVLECQELTNRAEKVSKQRTFNSVLDKMSEKFPAHHFGSNTTAHEGSSALPLAKLIPIFCNVVSSFQDGFDQFAAPSSDEVRTFSVNIFHSFSMPVYSYQ